MACRPGVGLSMPDRPDDDAVAGLGSFKLRLLGGFRLVRAERPVRTPESMRRLVTFVALHTPANRALAAVVLWPTVDEHHAHASLRTSLWQAQRRCPGLLVVTDSEVLLDAAVFVDLHELRHHARRVLEQPHTVPLTELTSPLVTQELLPGWYEDWVLQERERSRQLCLHTLEAAAEELLSRGRLGPALDVALAAVATEPLRESAHRLVIRIHIAEGNLSEALRHYSAFVQSLHADFGVGPTDQLRGLIADIRRQHSPGRSQARRPQFGGRQIRRAAAPP